VIMTAPGFDPSDSPVHLPAGHATARFEPISHDIACSVGREIEKSDLIFTNDPRGGSPGDLSTVGRHVVSSAR
jgi:hypothetical protein